MIHYILAGFDGMMYFHHDKNFPELKKSLLNEECKLIIYNPQSNNFSLLINMLDGYSDFLEITKEDFETIKKETSLEFQELDEIKVAVYWSTKDFEKQAEENFNELKKEYSKEYPHLDNWEQLYDKSKFAEQLEKMIKNHDANHGITWLTIEEYLYQCRKE